MLKALPIISKKIMVIMVVILFAVSMALFISPGKIYGAGLVTSITVTGAGSATTVVNGGTLQMSAAVFPVDAAQGVNWSVADVSGAAIIDNTGVLTGTGTGMVYVIATATDGSGVSGYLVITVTAPVLITSITVTGAAGAATLLNGSTLQMSAAVLPVGATNKGINWSVTSGSGTATINANGLLTGTAVGSVTVSATANDGSAIFGTFLITVTAPAPPPVLVTSITVTGAAGAATLLNGSTLQMSAAVLPADATNQSITWTAASGTGSAAIDATSGVLTGTGTGTVTVSATANDGSAIFGTFLITVTAPAPPAAAPTASDVTIMGTAQAGQTLTGSYTYSDINSDPEGTSTFKWLASDSADGIYVDISGAISDTFMLTSYQAGKFIKFEVTPAASAGTLLAGSAVQSAATTVELPAVKYSSGISGGSETKVTEPITWAVLAPSVSAVVYEKTTPGFVTLFYNRILNRAPDAEGLNGWVAGHTSGALTGADLVNGFIFSEENKVMTTGDTNEQFITSLYRLIFDRTPDADGFKSWLANINAGMTKEEVINYFASSAEFISLCNEYEVRP
ncbi:MAG: Ig-like domain-containing protein [Candidatus Humimicrobiaceae bacterium]